MKEENENGAATYFIKLSKAYSSTYSPSNSRICENEGLKLGSTFHSCIKLIPLCKHNPITLAMFAYSSVIEGVSSNLLASLLLATAIPTAIASRPG